MNIYCNGGPQTLAVDHYWVVVHSEMIKKH